MITIISPAKSLNFDSVDRKNERTTPMFLNDIKEVSDIMKEYEIKDFITSMKISENLAVLNFTRFQDFNMDFNRDIKEAIFAFDGDVYRALDAMTLSDEQIEFAQKHLRILSGLYGVLRPLDLIKEYRLEMGIKVRSNRGKNLYEFWGDIIKNYLEEELLKSEEKVLVNLASEEYSKAAKLKEFNKKVKVITPVFKEFNKGAYKVIGIHAKRARGLMTRYIIENNIDEASKLKDFDLNGYEFNEELSTDEQWIFTR